MANEQMLEAAPLWRRVVAQVIDLVVPAALVGLVLVLLPSMHELPGQLILVIAAAILTLGWWLLLWWGYGSRGAGVGYRAMGLRLVSIENGRPIGWGRFFLRQLVFFALWATVVGGVMLVIFLVIDADHRGWHDLSGRSVAVVAPRRQQGVIESVASERQTGTMVAVPLPAHLVAAQAQDVTQRGRRREPGTALRRRGKGTTTVRVPDGRPGGRGTGGRGVDKRLEAQFAPRDPAGHQGYPGAATACSGSAVGPGPDIGRYPASASSANPAATNPFVGAPVQAAPVQDPFGQARGDSAPSGSNAPAQGPGEVDNGAPEQGTRIVPRQNRPGADVADQGTIIRRRDESADAASADAGAQGTRIVERPAEPSADAGEQGTRIVQRRPEPDQGAGAQQDVGAQGTRIISRRITPPSDAGQVGTQIRSRRGRTEVAGQEQTVLAERAPCRLPQVRWFLMFDDGRELDLDAPVVVGRNPSAESGEHTMVVGADGTSVSKAHLRITAADGLVWVSDLASTNGTAILTVDGTEIVVPPNGRVQLGEGQVVAFGDHRLRLQRR